MGLFGFGKKKKVNAEEGKQGFQPTEKKAVNPPYSGGEVVGTNRRVTDEWTRPSNTFNATDPSTLLIAGAIIASQDDKKAETPDPVPAPESSHEAASYTAPVQHDSPTPSYSPSPSHDSGYSSHDSGGYSHSSYDSGSSYSGGGDSGGGGGGGGE